MRFAIDARGRCPCVQAGRSACRNERYPQVEALRLSIGTTAAVALWLCDLVARALVLSSCSRKDREFVTWRGAFFSLLRWLSIGTGLGLRVSSRLSSNLDCGQLHDGSAQARQPDRLPMLVRRVEFRRTGGRVGRCRGRQVTCREAIGFPPADGRWSCFCALSATSQQRGDTHRVREAIASG